MDCSDKRNLVFEVRTLSNLIKRGIDGENENLTVLQCRIIEYLYDNRLLDIFQKNFEEEFGMRRSSASKILSLMEKKGFVERRQVQHDARLKKLVLTEKAKQSYENAKKNIVSVQKKITNGIEERELEAFYSTLDKIRCNLESTEENA